MLDMYTADKLELVDRFCCLGDMLWCQGIVKNQTELGLGHISMSMLQFLTIRGGFLS